MGERGAPLAQENERCVVEGGGSSLPAHICATTRHSRQHVSVTRGNELALREPPPPPAVITLRGGRGGGAGGDARPIQRSAL